MTTISVIVGSHGAESWRRMGERAAASVEAQRAPDQEVIVVHDPVGTVATARNGGALLAHGTWLVFLDADDELAPGYLAAMTRAIREHGAADRLFTPRVQYVSGQHRQPPRFHPEVHYQDGNWLVIGTCVPRSLFVKVGGFEEWPIYEDWALFARMQDTGAEVIRVPDAVYVAHRRQRSRNHSLVHRDKVEQHHAIRRAIWPHLYEDAA